MTVSVFCGTSLDGFIARTDGALDFLDAGASGEAGADTSFDDFLATVDVLVMGRATWDVFRGFGQWPYGERSIIVLTNRSLDVPDMFRGKVEAMQGTPGQVVERLAARGLRRVYVDGGQVVQQFLRAGLVDRIVVTRVPVLIGQGIPLFGSLPRDIKLRHVGTKALGGGMVQSEYAVLL